MLKNKKRRKIIVIVLITILLLAGTNEVFGVDDIIGAVTNGVAGLFLLIPKFLLVALGAAIRTILGFFVGKGMSGLSMQDILFNKVPITDINFFDFSSTDSTVNAIRENVAAWYIGIRNLAAVLLVIVALYVGLRMAISTIAEDKAKYKHMLVDWITSICILFLLHYIMVLIIQVNNTLVETIGNQQNLKNQNLEDVANKFRDYALGGDNVFSWVTSGVVNGFTDGFAPTFAAAVIYVMMELMTIVFLLTYIKRMITIGFLIIIAPLVTVTYSIDKMGDGRSQALNHWIKEFTYNILIQPFQCVTYLALCSTSFEVLQKDPDFKSAVIAIAMMIFLVRSEEIIKKIFHFQAESMASTVSEAALVSTMISSGRRMFGEAKSSSSSSGSRVPRSKSDGSLPPPSNSGNIGTVDINDNGGADGRNSGAVPPSRGGDDGSQQSQGQGNGTSSSSNSTTQQIGSSQSTATPRDRGSNNKVSKPGSKARNIGAKATDAIIRGNAAVLGLGIGLAAGGATGDLKTAITTSMQMSEAIGGRGRKIAGETQTSHYKKEVARAFENYRAYKESLGEQVTEEQIGREGMELLFGEREARTEEERAYRDALINMQNNYMKNGSDEKESLKEVQRVIEGVETGEITEQWVAQRYFASGKNSIKKTWNGFMAKHSKSSGTRLSGQGRRGSSGEGGSEFGDNRGGPRASQGGQSQSQGSSGPQTPQDNGSESGNNGEPRSSGGSSSGNPRTHNGQPDDGTTPQPTPQQTTTPPPTSMPVEPPLTDEGHHTSPDSSESDHGSQPRGDSDSSGSSNENSPRGGGGDN